MFESELFGHVKGAFTDAKTDRVGCFELADGGTLFLDEIANMPAEQQAKLLRVLQTGEFQRVGSSRTRRVDVRVLAATNADIRARGRRGPVPRGPALPAQHRRDPAAAAARAPRGHPAARRRTSSRETRRGIASRCTGFDRGAMAALLAHAWPGNVRELEHAVERAVLLAPRGDRSTREDLGLRAPAPWRRRRASRR